MFIVLFLFNIIFCELYIELGMVNIKNGFIFKLNNIVLKGRYNYVIL